MTTFEISQPIVTSAFDEPLRYLYDGQMHDYVPDFLVRLVGGADQHVILETKGFDPRADLKAAAAQRWVNAVNTDRRYGHWQYHLIRIPSEVRETLDACSGPAVTG